MIEYNKDHKCKAQMYRINGDSILGKFIVGMIILSMIGLFVGLFSCSKLILGISITVFFFGVFLITTVLY